MMKHLYSKCIKNSQSSIVEKNNNNPGRTWTKDTADITKEKIEMANKHIKRCSPSSAIRECKIKTTVRPEHLLEQLE